MTYHQANLDKWNLNIAENFGVICAIGVLFMLAQFVLLSLKLLRLLLLLEV